MIYIIVKNIISLRFLLQIELKLSLSVVNMMLREK